MGNAQAVPQRLKPAYLAAFTAGLEGLLHPLDLDIAGSRLYDISSSFAICSLACAAAERNLYSSILAPQTGFSVYYFFFFFGCFLGASLGGFLAGLGGAFFAGAAFLAGGFAGAAFD
jgi:hypothetical protein